jgi:hypothetical protein
MKGWNDTRDAVPEKYLAPISFNTNQVEAGDSDPNDGTSVKCRSTGFLESQIRGMVKR